MTTRCSDCGGPAGTFGRPVDGTDRRLCAACIRDSIDIAWQHEQLRRLHFAVHGHDDPCPVCASDAWLIRQRRLEAEASAEVRAIADAQQREIDAQLDAIVDRLR